MARSAAKLLFAGGLILAARVGAAALLPASAPVVEVHTAAGATAAEVARAVDEAVLVEEAQRRGWARTDPVVRRRLVANMRFADGEPDDGPALSAARERVLFERAVALGMERVDPVARRRLIERAERAIERGAPFAEPTDDELRVHLESHAERFSAPPRVRFSQVFLSRERRGGALAADAVEMAERLAVTPIAPEEASRLGDPFAHDPRGLAVSLEHVARTYGDDFAAAVLGVEPGGWSGPHRSAYGLHFVWVHESTAGDVADLDEVRDRVRRSLRRDRRIAHRTHLLRQLRARYRVRVTTVGEDGAR